MATTRATCPMCNSSAEMTPGPHDDYRHYVCPTCVEFLITPAADKHMRSDPQYVRDGFSGKAQKSNETQIYSIARASREELDTEPTTTLSGRMIQR